MLFADLDASGERAARYDARRFTLTRRIPGLYDSQMRNEVSSPARLIQFRQRLSAPGNVGCVKKISSTASIASTRAHRRKLPTSATTSSRSAAAGQHDAVRWYASPRLDNDALFFDEGLTEHG
jgi:hypothetical protein